MLGPEGCSWGFWLLRHCLPLTGGAMVAATSTGFLLCLHCSRGGPSGVLPGLQPQHLTAWLGLGLIGVHAGHGSCASSSSSSSSSPHCWLPLAMAVSPLPLSVLHRTCGTLPGRHRCITACQSCHCRERGGGKLISPDHSNPTGSSPVSFLLR